jgi:hypothetical protein
MDLWCIENNTARHALEFFGIILCDVLEAPTQESGKGNNF